MYSRPLKSALTTTSIIILVNVVVVYTGGLLGVFGSLLFALGLYLSVHCHGPSRVVLGGLYFTNIFLYAVLYSLDVKFPESGLNSGTQFATVLVQCGVMLSVFYMISSDRILVKGFESGDKQRSRRPVRTSKAVYLSHLAEIGRLKAACQLSELVVDSVIESLQTGLSSVDHVSKGSPPQLREHVKRLSNLKAYLSGTSRGLTAVNLNRTVQDLVSILSEGKSQPWISWQCDLDPELCEVSGNNRDFQTLMLHLLLNAIEAFDNQSDESNCIRIVSMNQGQTVCLAIEDNGKGLDQRTLKQAFQPFFTKSKPQSLSGVGLSVARQIVENYKGRIEVNSEHGAGTRVLVTFPANGRSKKAV